MRLALEQQLDDCAYKWKMLKSILMDSIRATVLVSSISSTTRDFTNSNSPYLTPSCAAYLSQFPHLLVDLPSVDKETDSSTLAHHAFFGSNGITITELCRIPLDLNDGLYALNLQVISSDLDASQSRPLIYDILPLYLS